MIEYTHNNYWQFGWNDGTYNFNDKFKGKFWAKFGRAQYITTDFAGECRRAARLIASKTNRPIVILFSGGVDSEIVVRAFQQEKIPFETATMVINYAGHKNINNYDNVYAVNYCKQHNIKQHLLEVDFENYLQNPDYFEYKSNKIGFFMQQDLIRRLPNYYLVYGLNFWPSTEIKHFNNIDGTPIVKAEVFITETLLHTRSITLALENNVEMTGRFFIYTPELALSWLLHPDVQHWNKYAGVVGPSVGNSWGHMSSITLKQFVIYKLFPDLIPREKYGGFESPLLYPTYVNLRRNYANLIDTTNTTHKITIDELLNMLLPNNTEKEHEQLLAYK